MTLYNSIIQSYSKALLVNDYQAMIGLFSSEAKVFGALAGEKPVPEFYQNLFKASSRTKVELKNMFITSGVKPSVAAYLYIEAVRSEGFIIKFECVDIFEFNSENKITTLRIIMDTYPFRKMLADALATTAKLG